jgi:hypothetical protein
MCELFEPKWKFKIFDPIEFDFYPRNKKDENPRYTGKVVLQGHVHGMCLVPGSGSYYAYIINSDPQYHNGRYTVPWDMVREIEVS